MIVRPRPGVRTALWLIVLVVAAGGTTATGTAATLDPETRTRVVGRIAELIAENYFDPERADRIATELRGRLAEGAYDRYDHALDLASALSAQLEAHDRHFRVDWASPGAAEPASLEPHSDETLERWRRWSRLQNFGFRRIEVLPGNIGYLDLRYFDDPAIAGDTALAAMAVLANTDAVIVDLRDNGGGEPGMVQLLISHFFGPEPVQYNRFVSRTGGTSTTRQLWTLPHLPGKRMASVPLYVLTGARTGSAAEAFAYSLQALERATVVGRATAGAANPGDGFDAGDGFGVFISTGAVVHPVTGGSWEGVGVRPDVDVPSDRALDTARSAALRHLLGDADDPVEKREIDWALESLEAKRRPLSPSRSELEPYVGTYGSRAIRLDGDRLVYQRGRRPVRVMLPLGDDVFLLDGVDGFRLRFERDESGAVVRLVDMWSDGHVESNYRE